MNDGGEEMGNLQRGVACHVMYWWGVVYHVIPQYENLPNQIQESFEANSNLDYHDT